MSGDRGPTTLDFGGRRRVLAATPPRSASISVVIPVFCHMPNQLGYVAGVSELDTQRDVVKIGSADDEVSDVVRRAKVL